MYNYTYYAYNYMYYYAQSSITEMFSLYFFSSYYYLSIFWLLMKTFYHMEKGMSILNVQYAWYAIV